MSEQEKTRAEATAKAYAGLSPTDKAYMDGVVDGMTRAYQQQETKDIKEETK